MRVGRPQRVSMSFERLPEVVRPGDKLFLNDGLVRLVVERVQGNDVHCTVSVGGELHSRASSPAAELRTESVSKQTRGGWK